MSCHSYSSPSALGSSLGVEPKLKKVWKRIQNSSPLLACLVDIETISDAGMTIIEQITMKGENIMKQFRAPISLRLLQMKTKFYVQLFVTDAQIWAEICSTRDGNEAEDIITDMKDAPLLDTSIESLDDSIASEKSILQSIKWPSIVYSTIKTALENFSSTPRYSKEAFVLHSPSPAVESTFTIDRGEVLCIKMYRPRGLLTLTSFYHFGVYVGKMTTKYGKDLDHIIELTKDKDTKLTVINAVPLEGNEKGNCFVLTKTKSGHPPLLFKVVYGNRTQQEKEETAKRALDFYNNSEYCLKEYSLFSNNCEHFVNKCAFVNSYCEQHARFILTTLPNMFKGSPLVTQTLRAIFIAISEVIEVTSKSSNKVLSFLGESFALAMLMTEFAFRIIWDIYLLKKSGRLTLKNVLHLVKRHLVSMGPELVAGIVFLLVAVQCSTTGPIGFVIGISGTVILLALRLIARPRIERWIERREAARLEDFLQWHPHEVARLAMTTSEENNTRKEILENFDLNKLSGKTISDFINRERENPSENYLAKVLQFLDPDRLERFKQNLKNIFGHFDISKQLKSCIKLTYGEQSISINIPDMGITTMRRLLEIARLNWHINFVKGDWQVSEVNIENQSKSVIASSAQSSSIDAPIETSLDSPTTLELLYEKPSACTLL